MHGTSLAAEVDFNGSDSSYFLSIFEQSHILQSIRQGDDMVERKKKHMALPLF